VVFSRLDDIIDSLGAYDVLLTPHQTKPEKSLEGVIDQEICSLKHGIYNLGFVAVANTQTGKDFTKWWSERLSDFCRDDIANGLFTDQRWCDLVPALFSGVGILRDSRLNVSTWNITNREMSLTESGEYLVDGKPLGFYHFTGFDSGAHKIMAVKNGGSNPALRRLIDWYQNQTACKGGNTNQEDPWAYGCFSNGTLISPKQRIVYRDRKDLQTAFPNPFDSETYLVWWNTRGRKEYPELFKEAEKENIQRKLNNEATLANTLCKVTERFRNFIKATCRYRKGIKPKKAVLVLDAHAGLCNQMMDIESLVNFAVENHYQFCFRYCSFRNSHLTSWAHSEFGSLFDEREFQDLPGYLCFKKNTFKNSKVWNSEGKGLTGLINAGEEIMPLAYQYDFMVISAGWPVLGVPKFRLGLNKRIKPARYILRKYKKLRAILPEKYNFLHYRYEHDFTSHFSAESPENSFPILQEILDAKLFSNMEIPIYIAASGLASLPKPHLKEDITRQKNIIFTDEKRKDGFNYEASAYLDFLIGEQAVEVFGHSRSSFSVRLNNIKNSRNFYDISLK
jgi:hypothetical protein